MEAGKGARRVVKKFRIQFRKCLGEKLSTFWRIWLETKVTFAYCQVSSVKGGWNRGGEKGEGMSVSVYWV